MASRVIKLVDIAVNLTDSVFVGVYRGKHSHSNDLLHVIQRAHTVGVDRLIITGTTLDESKTAYEMAVKYNLYSTVGCHPTHAQDIENHPKGSQDYFDSLLALIQSEQSSIKRIVAIGECGLDYDRTHFCPIDIQKRHFVGHFQLAHRTGLPILFHNRNTGTDFIDLVKTHRHLFSTGVVHSFDGSITDLNIFTKELDLYIGINGCSLKTDDQIQVVKQIPLDRLLLETDAPWCDIRPTHASFPFLSAHATPDPLDILGPEAKKKEKFIMGQRVKGRNEPCTLLHVLRVVAGIKNMDEHDLADIVYQNTLKVFFPTEYHSTEV
ncbi:hypothetical protein BDEG_28274 [Batrachochytrium dendrobatidis JEL423]|uniref:TatD family hydrolase n=2 Tax=Batrachochytrium dendrobatidis (strain JEL423) TaxID=403673 RepID=A0A177X020_BATDL|nr:hypothetical protein BDEG_28274 [Batrachochytrium dendrobatidis JEL423]